MEGKRTSAKECNHSSFYSYVSAVVEGRKPLFDQNHCSSGGAFPIRINGEWKYTIAVSGLHEGKDHEIIVRALEIFTKRKTESFPYMMV